MKIVLVICFTLLVITGERFCVSMEDIGIRKRKIAVQEEALRIIRQRNEEPQTFSVAPQPEGKL